MLAASPLGPSGRHAVELVAGFEKLLSAEGLKPADVREVYVSVGPGSFTGLRVGITVARTLGQMIPAAKLVAVPTPLAVAENIAAQPWKHLGVLLAAKDETHRATLIGRDEQNHPQIIGQPKVAGLAELLCDWPRPLWLSGEALGYCRPTPEKDVEIVAEDHRLPTVESVWRVGRRLATAGMFTPFTELLPVYARRPEAVRLWEQKTERKQP
jgi:tRNA threonylcarbamoyladenosine biosynthesis protein TsaB